MTPWGHGESIASTLWGKRPQEKWKSPLLKPPHMGYFVMTAWAASYRYLWSCFSHGQPVRWRVCSCPFHVVDDRSWVPFGPVTTEISTVNSLAASFLQQTVFLYYHSPWPPALTHTFLLASAQTSYSGVLCPEFIVLLLGSLKPLVIVTSQSNLTRG